MSNIATLRADTPLAFQMDEAELMSVLRTSLYPGAKDSSIKMVLSYCKAAGLDPMQKPVHIVPMYDKTTKEMRDVIMPGIGLYRTQAARSGELAGISEPTFDDDQENFGITFPMSCAVTVKRLVAGVERDFTAREYWVENYATAGRDTNAPNAMWKKRPRGQLAKCAQAQALRMAFPEMTGAAPTADEMEGKFEEVDAATGEIIAKKPAVTMPKAKSAPTPPPDDNITDAEIKHEKQPTDDTLATVGEVAYIGKRITAKGVSITEALLLAGMDGDTLDGLTKDGFIALRDALK